MKRTKPEAKGMFKLTARVAPALADAAKIRAIQEGRSLQAVVIDALTHYLRRPLPKRKEKAGR
jgi:predicted HicB family RNase H-like nuclease